MATARRRLAIATALAATTVSLACQLVVGLEASAERPEVAPTDAAPEGASDGSVDAGRACRTPDGGPCFCERVGNPTAAPVLRCVDFDEEVIDPDTFNLGPGLPQNVGGPLSLTLDRERPLSPARALLVSVRVGDAIGFEQRSITADASPLQTSIQWSSAFGSPDDPLYDGGPPNRTKGLLAVELGADTRQAIAVGIDFGKYFVTVLDDIQNIQKVGSAAFQDAAVPLPGSLHGPDASFGYRTFVLSVEEADCQTAGGLVHGLTAIIRGPSDDPARPSVALACAPIGSASSVKFSDVTRVYIGGYVKNPFEPLEWRFDDIVIRRRADAG